MQRIFATPGRQGRTRLSCFSHDPSFHTPPHHGTRPRIQERSRWRYVEAGASGPSRGRALTDTASPLRTAITPPQSRPRRLQLGHQRQFLLQRRLLGPRPQGECGRSRAVPAAEADCGARLRELRTSSMPPGSLTPSPRDEQPASSSVTLSGASREWGWRLSLSSSLHPAPPRATGTTRQPCIQCAMFDPAFSPSLASPFRSRRSSVSTPMGKAPLLSQAAMRSPFTSQASRTSGRLTRTSRVCQSLAHCECMHGNRPGGRC